MFDYRRIGKSVKIYEGRNMRLQILSDLHIEGDDRFQIPNIKSDLIILAGDIHRGIKAAEWSIEQSNKLNKPIMQIAGNHEYYGLYYENVNGEIEEITKNTKLCLFIIRLLSGLHGVKIKL